MADTRLFPVKGGQMIRAVPWYVVEPFQLHAMQFFEQPLELLAESDGLTPLELIRLVSGKTIIELQKGGGTDTDAEIMLAAMICQRI